MASGPVARGVLLRMARGSLSKMDGSFIYQLGITIFQAVQSESPWRKAEGQGGSRLYVRNRLVSSS